MSVFANDYSLGPEDSSKDKSACFTGRRPVLKPQHNMVQKGLCWE